MTSEKHVKSKVSAAFGLVIGLMITIVIINITNLNNAVQRLDHVVGIHNAQMSIMNGILDLARQRSLTLQGMLLDNDPFQFDEQVLLMSQIGSGYLKLRKRLLDLPYTEEEFSLLEEQHTHSVKTGQVQSQVMNMISEGDHIGAQKVFFEKAIPSQLNAMALMQDFVALQDRQNNHERSSTKDDVKSKQNQSVILLGIGLIMSVSIAFWIIRRLSNEINRRNRIETDLESLVEERTRQVERLSKQAAEARLQTLFDAAPEFIFVIDATGNILQTNAYAAKYSAYSIDEIVGKNIKDFFTEESKQTCDCTFPELKQSGSSRSDIEFICKDGHIINMECAATAVHNQDGEFSSFMIIQRDVTENRQAAKALADSERRFRTLFNSTYQFISVLDTNGVVLEVNKTLLDFIGGEQADILGTPFFDALFKGESESASQTLCGAIQRASKGSIVHLEFDIKGKGGSEISVEFTLEPVMNDEGNTGFLIAEGRDITEKRKAEEEAKRHIRESAHFMRLSTMGEMASGMAHELNQPLTAIISYCDTMSSMASELHKVPEELKDILDRVGEQAHRAGCIIKQMRSFVGKGDTEKYSIDLDSLMRKVFNYVNWDIKYYDIDIKMIPGSHGCKILGNEIQLEQVILNLVMNSMEAIQDGNIENAKLILHSCINPDSTIEFTVTDNGPGVDPAIIDMAFDPFQTSKLTGMGLGLSISRSIINSHGGKLWIDKHYNDGARFGFALPVYES